MYHLVIALLDEWTAQSQLRGKRQCLHTMYTNRYTMALESEKYLYSVISYSTRPDKKPQRTIRKGLFLIITVPISETNFRFESHCVTVRVRCVKTPAFSLNRD